MELSGCEVTDEVNVSEALAGLDLKEFDCISFLSVDKPSLVIPAIKTAVQSAVGYTHLVHQLVESDEPQDVVQCALHLLKDVKEGSSISISATQIKRDKYTLAGIANNVSR